MTVDYHRLEKGLSLASSRDGFGKDVVDRLTTYLPDYERRFGYDGTCATVENVLHVYAAAQRTETEAGRVVSHHRLAASSAAAPSAGAVLCAGRYPGGGRHITAGVPERRWRTGRRPPRRLGLASQLGVQALGVAAVCAWSAIASFAILLLCKFTVGLRASPENIEDGLDMGSHGERRQEAQMLAIRLDVETEQRLEALATRTGRTKTFYAREAIAAHLDDLEDFYLAEERLRTFRDSDAIPLATLKAEQLSSIDDTEDAMLDCTGEPRQPHSRLSCQIMVT
eukprot:gene10641-14280_t